MSRTTAGTEKRCILRFKLAALKPSKKKKKKKKTRIRSRKSYRVLAICNLPLLIRVIIIIILIYTSTVRVVGALQMISQPFFSIFLVLHCPLGPAGLQACPFPNVVVPPLPLSALSSSPFHGALQAGRET